MNSDNQHIDGDDYTWGGDALQPAAVLKPADAFAELQAQFGAYFDAIPDVDAFVREQRGCEPGTVAAWVERWRIGSGATLLNDAGTLARVGPDLRTADQVERDDAAQLALRCDNLVDALAAMGGRVAALERTVAALAKVLEVRI